jgi:hypothetical protein
MTGRLLVDVARRVENEHEFTLRFITHYYMFCVIALSLSALVLIRVALTGLVGGLVAIPFIILSGHVYFWGMLPSRVRKMKESLIKLDK